MEVSIEQMKRNYSILASEELLKMHASGELTETAYNVLEEELSKRGITIPQRPQESVFIVKYTTWRELWKGEAPLSSAWGLLAVLGFAANISSFIIGDRSSTVVNVVLGLVFLPLFTFSLMAIWRCAWNSAWKGWGYISRTVVVLVLIVLIYTGLSDFS